MKIEVDKKIVESTECEKEFECLNCQDNFCKVVQCINDKVHFLKCDEKECKFKISFGKKEFFCTCPVRKEIYNRYKI